MDYAKFGNGKNKNLPGIFWDKFQTAAALCGSRPRRIEEAAASLMTAG